MRIRDNLSGIARATSNPNKSIPPNTSKAQIGKVYGVVLNENTPSRELFERAGGWQGGIGSVYYLDYNASKNIDTDQVNIDSCKIAKPLHANIQNYPLKGELIVLVGAPSPVGQVDNSSSQKYYSGTVNIWNNIQQNSPDSTNLGKTFTQNADVRSLIPFEGDLTIQSRNGSGIRFGSTVSAQSNLNEWSSIGNNGDPITILVNGYVTTDITGPTANVEEINKEKSSIYLTSTQTLPLQPGASIINPRVNTVLPKDYKSSQLILNSDRITLNSKKDEILLFAKTNIELNSDNVININAGRVAHINSPSIALGTNSDGTYPTEPALLGNKTYELFIEICGTLTTLAGFLSTAAVSTNDGAISVTDCNLAGDQLFNDVSNLLDKLESITSNKVYIA
jgi:hypothetical protein